jgi:hypothetical protein
MTTSRVSAPGVSGRVAPAAEPSADPFAVPSELRATLSALQGEADLDRRGVSPESVLRSLSPQARADVEKLLGPPTAFNASHYIAGRAGGQLFLLRPTAEANGPARVLGVAIHNGRAVPVGGFVENKYFGRPGKLVLVPHHELAGLHANLPDWVKPQPRPAARSPDAFEPGGG